MLWNYVGHNNNHWHTLVSSEVFIAKQWFSSSILSTWWHVPHQHCLLCLLPRDVTMYFMECPDGMEHLLQRRLCKKSCSTLFSQSRPTYLLEDNLSMQSHVLYVNMTFGLDRGLIKDYNYWCNWSNIKDHKLVISIDVHSHNSRRQ